MTDSLEVHTTLIQDESDEIVFIAAYGVFFVVVKYVL